MEKTHKAADRTILFFNCLHLANNFIAELTILYHFIQSEVAV